MSATYLVNDAIPFYEVFRKFLRLTTSAGLGVLVTGLLLFLMCSLIAMDPPDIDTQVIRVTQVVMDDTSVIEVLPEPITPKPVDPAPMPQLPQFSQQFEAVKGVDIAVAPIVEPGAQDVGRGFSSGTALAIFKVAPEYPRRHLSRGVEGFVDLMFDITPTGKTENIRVIYAEPQGAFERSSVTALSKWKYKPAMNDGVAIAQKNQTTRITYELEQ